MSASDRSHLIGRRFADGSRAFEVLHWSPRRPGLCEIRVTASSEPSCPAGTVGWASVRDVLAARPDR